MKIKFAKNFYQKLVIFSVNLPNSLIFSEIYGKLEHLLFYRFYTIKKKTERQTIVTAHLHKFHSDQLEPFLLETLKDICN